MAVKPIPEGYHTVTPYLVVNGAERVVQFMKDAFGAKERLRMPGPNDTIGHAEIEIGDSVVMIADPQDDPVPGMLSLYLEDVDAAYQRALDAGGTSIMEPADQFYGDRMAGVRDPGGNKWYLATHVEDVPPEELERRSAELAAKAETGSSGQA